MKGQKFKTRIKIYCGGAGDLEKGTRLVVIDDTDVNTPLLVKEEDYVRDPFNILGLGEYLHEKKEVYQVYREYLEAVKEFNKADCDWRYRAACASDGDCADFCDMECPYKKEDK